MYAFLVAVTTRHGRLRHTPANTFPFLYLQRPPSSSPTWFPLGYLPRRFATPISLDWVPILRLGANLPAVSLRFHKSDPDHLVRFLRSSLPSNPGIRCSVQEGLHSSSSSAFPPRPDLKEKVHVFSERFDGWIRDSATEIVKNLGKAPLFVRVYDGDDGILRLQTEEALRDEWWAISEGWRKEEATSPDGLILVEELEGEDSWEGGGEGEIGERAWGVMIQGKGMECSSPACYLLKTSSVGSGMGSICTHFCLNRVMSFRRSATSQLRECWLLGS